MSRYGDKVDGFAAGQKAETRPAGVTDDHLDFLDALRDSGNVNMFGARPHLVNAFPDLDDKTSATVLSYWMKSFGDRHPG